MGLPGFAWRPNERGKQMQTIPIGRLAEHIAKMGEAKRETSAYRMAYRMVSRSVFAEAIVKAWASRGAMLEACKMSDTGALDALPWKPCEK